MDVMDRRRLLLSQNVTLQQITVEWNQWLQPMTSANWQPYHTYTTITFDDVNEIATNNWLEQRAGYSSSIRNKVGTLQASGQIWYTSHMINPSKGGLNWGVEFAGGRQHTCVIGAAANEWVQVSSVGDYYRGTRNYTYIANCKSVASDTEVGMTAQCKSPILINLTQMFGAGHEPSKTRFEALCAFNNIDLTVYHPYDEGTTLTWTDIP